MRNLLLASATAISLLAAPTLAQDQADAPLGSTNSIADKRSFTPEQQAVYDRLEPEFRTLFDAWEPDRQVMYFGWTDALRGYYHTLDPRQQEAWWYLSPEQRIDMFQMQGEQRELAWNDVLSQVAAAEAGTPAATTAAASGQTSFVSNSVVQQAPAPHSGEYPVCTSDADDNCINAWAAGERGPGVTRPLDHWPGKPASS